MCEIRTKRMTAERERGEVDSMQPVLKREQEKVNGFMDVAFETGAG